MVKEDQISDKDYKKMRKGRLFVKNFPFDIDIEKLEKTFRKCGDIESFNFPRKNGSQGELKGYGFVQYKHKNMALKAIKNINNRLINGRRVEVTLALQKKVYETKKVAPDEQKKSKTEKSTQSSTDSTETKSENDKGEKIQENPKEDEENKKKKKKKIRKRRNQQKIKFKL